MKRPTMLLSLVLLISLAPAALAGDDEFKEPINLLDDEGQKIGQVPAERVPLPFEEERGDARLGVTRAGHVYVALGKTLCWRR